MPIEVFTQRGMIRTVAARWHAQYDNYRSVNPNWSHFGVGAKLDALDVETASRDEVDAVIGNGSWTNLACNNCGERDLPAVVQVGEKADYESATAVLCMDCAQEAVRMLDYALAESES